MICLTRGGKFTPSVIQWWASYKLDKRVNGKVKK